MSETTTLEFRVRGMDCAEEVTALKRAVGPIVGSEDRLSFNLMTGKMTVSGGAAESGEILQAVRETEHRFRLGGESRVRAPDLARLRNTAIAADMGASLLVIFNGLRLLRS